MAKYLALGARIAQELQDLQHVVERCLASGGSPRRRVTIATWTAWR